jgi:prepilin-type N-terminal cleavage/methylation domain-containing protein
MHTRRSQGFSLIELLVALSIFAIIMTASVGTLLTLIDMNAKGQALYTATTNLSFALDSITRELRMGYTYYCDLKSAAPSNLPAGQHDCSASNFVAFNRERDGVRVGYYYDVTQKTLQQKVGSDAWKPITDPDEVLITSFELITENTDPLTSSTDDEQPSVGIRIAGEVQNALPQATDFNIQTRIMQRKIDLY